MRKGTEALVNNRLDFLHGLVVFSIKHLIYLVLVTCTAFTALRYFKHDQSYWLVWSALVLSLITAGDTFKERAIVILLTGMAASVSAFLAACCVPVVPFLALYLFILTLACMWFGQLFSRYFFSAFIIDLFAVLSGGLAVSLHEALARFIFILLGLLIALVFQVIFSFRFVRNESLWFAILALWQLKKLNNEIFSCFLQAEYADNIYLYERRLHVQKNKCLQVIDRLRDLNKNASPPADRMKFLQKKFAQIFDLLLDCAQLRRRVSDHTTFAICNTELTAICQEIDRLLGGVMLLLLGKKLFPNISMFHNKIQKLEDNYNHVLQISSREPLVFLLFIFSLKALSNEMLECYAAWVSTQ